MSPSWPWRVLAALGAVASLAGAPWPAPPASAQAGVVSLALESQSPWNSPERPLEIVVRATNDSSERLEQLSIALTIRTPARSRSAYELSLRADATSSFFTYPFVREGALDPGESRTFGLQQPLELLTNRGESALYPLEIELRSHDAPVATLRSPMIFLIEPAKVPLSLVWTWIMAAPIDHGPDGVFLSEALESDLAPGGRLRAMAEALSNIEGVPATIAPSSALLDQLTSMADGYEVSPPGGELRTVAAGSGGAADATAVLGMLREVAGRPEIETVAYPFGDPSLPALFKAGLGKDFGPLLSRGRTLVREALGVSPSTTVIRPPLSHLDPGTLVRLVSSGVRTVLLDQGLVPPPLDPTFSAPAVVRLSSGTEAVSAVVPDPGLPLVATAASADPRLAAHAALGWLAAMWFEFPGTPGRGAAVLFGEESPYPAEFFEAFAPLVRSSPWLRPLAAEAFVDDIDPQGRAVMSPRSYPALDPSYVASVQRGKGQLRRFEDTLQEPDPVTERLRAHLFLAEGGTFVARPDLGTMFVDGVSATIRRIYSRVTIPSQTFTLTSRSGVIPVQVRNDTGHELRVRVRLVSDRRLEFVNGDTATILLPPEDRIVRFAVSARTTGLLPIKVQIQTLGGDPTPDTISEAQVLVRSTAYNRVALFVTIGAALFLLAWWGRRFLPRRRP